MTNFASDNTHGASPEILAALAEANAGAVPSYGDDPITERVTRRLTEIFECPAWVFPVATGTAANSLALAAVTPPWGAVLCHRDAHIAVDEANAPEFYTGGAKLVLLDGSHGKVTPETVGALLPGGLGVVHHAQPAALSLTQATEAGTVYRPSEVAALSEIVKRHGLAMHMDGARFANALVSLDCTPAEMTWRSGVDVLSFGATKNGAIGAEAVIFFNEQHARDFGFRRKRAGHLFSKMRFLSAQLDAYLAEDLWLRNARRANAAAARLAAGLGSIDGVRLRHPVQANELFVELPEPLIQRLEAAGFVFYRWDAASIRLVTAFDTSTESIDAFVAVAKGGVGERIEGRETVPGR